MAFGLLGNFYLLGGLIEDMIDDIGDQVNEIKGNIKDIKTDVAGLMRLQTELEVNDILRVEKLIKGCGKNYLEIDELTLSCRNASSGEGMHRQIYTDQYRSQSVQRRDWVGVL